MTNLTPELNKALAELQTQLPHIAKDKTAKIESQRTGKSHSYKFADLSDVSEQILPLLGKLGLAFTSRPTMSNGIFVLAYELRHVSGEQTEGEFPLSQSASPQDIGIWITYARRYCLCAVTGLAPGGDDDAAGIATKATRAPRETTKTEPGVTVDQQRQMGPLFQKIGINDKDARIQYVIDTIGREVHSVTEVTRAEGGKLLDRLETSAAQVDAAAAGDA